jgi:hypothetical protein
MNSPDRRSQAGDSYAAGLGGIKGEDFVGAAVGDEQPPSPIEAKSRWCREAREPGFPAAVPSAVKQIGRVWRTLPQRYGSPAVSRDNRCRL